VIVATGIVPRTPPIDGIDHPKVLSYLDVLKDNAPVGRRVAIVGAGGIGFDVAEFLTQDEPSPTTDIARWSHEWGVDRSYANRGGLARPVPEASPREVWLLQRTPGTPGKRLNKTTGWVHRAALKMKNVKMLGGVDYERVDDAGCTSSSTAIHRYCKWTMWSSAQARNHVVICTTASRPPMPTCT